MGLGARIKECRSAKKLTLQQVGDHFGINRASVSDWEREQTRPDLDRLVSLARLFNTTTDYLLTGKKSASDSWPFSIPRGMYDELDATAKAEIDTMLGGMVELRYLQRSKLKTGS